MSNPARHAMDVAARALSMEPEWCEESDGRLTWWASGVPTTMWYDEPFTEDEFTIYRLHARTSFIKGFRPSRVSLERLNTFLQQSAMSGIVASSRGEGCYDLATSIYLHEDTVHINSMRFAASVLLQASAAHMWASLPCDHGAWTPNRSAHPASGIRLTPSSLLTGSDFGGVLAAFSRQKGGWPAEEFLALRRFVNTPPFVLGTVHDTGLTAELPFQEFTSLLEMKLAVDNVLGHGLSVSLSLPLNPEHAVPESLAVSLNNAEISSMTRIPFWGSWCWRGNCLTFVSFVPDMVFGPGLVEHIVMATAFRAAWAAEVTAGDDWSASFGSLGRPRVRGAVDRFLSRLGRKSG